VFEKLGDDFLFEGGGIFDNEGFPVIGPAAYLWITRVNHMIRFLEKDWRLLHFLSGGCRGYCWFIMHEGCFGNGIFHR